MSLFLLSSLRSKYQIFQEKRRRNYRSGKYPSGDETIFDPPTVTLSDNPVHVQGTSTTTADSSLSSLTNRTRIATSNRNDNSDNHSSSNNGDNNNNNNHFTFLYSLTRRWAWIAVAHRCETHPHEVQRMEQDSSGDTILHWACFGSPPLYAIEAILLACPELVMIPNKKGFLPIHTACSYRASSDIIRALVQAYPPSAGIPILSNNPNHDNNDNHPAATIEQQQQQQQERNSVATAGGSTPLHLLCDYGCRADLIRAILESPEGVYSTQLTDHIYHRRPIEILNERKSMTEFHSHLTELRRLCERNPHALEGIVDGDDDDTRQEDHSMETKLLLERIRSMGFWEKFELLAMAEYTQQPITMGVPPSGEDDEEQPQQQQRQQQENPQRPSHPSSTTVVHAMLHLYHCPPSVLEFGCFFMSHVLLQRDEYGDLPLHIATRQSPSSSLWWSDDIIQCILEIQPLAASLPDATGVFPLELYINGRRHDHDSPLVGSWTPLIKKFIVAFPMAVEHLNLDRRLYPLLWSRLNRLPNKRNPSDDDVDDLNALFLSIQSSLPVFLESSTLQTTVDIH